MNLVGDPGDKTLTRHVLIRVLPLALALLAGLGGVFLIRERQMVKDRLSERLELAATRNRDLFFQRVEALRGQVRMLADHHLVQEALGDSPEHLRDLSPFFQSLGGVAGSTVQARFALLNARGEEILSNEREGGPPMPELGAKRDPGQELFLLDDRGAFFAAPVIVHGSDLGAAALSMESQSIREYASSGDNPAFAIALFDRHGCRILANPRYRDMAGDRRIDQLPGWLVARADISIEGTEGWHYLIGLSPREVHAEFAHLHAQTGWLLALALSLLLATLVLATRLTVRPVARLANNVRNIARRLDLGARVASEGPRELRDLADAFNQTLAELERAFTSRESMRTLLDNIQTQIWYLTDDHTYGAVNEAHAAFFGRRKEDIAFKDMADFMPPEAVAICRVNNREVFSSGKVVHSEEWATDSLGRQRLLSIQKAPKLRPDGSIEYVVASA